jgi:hypothetical protein
LLTIRYKLIFLKVCYMKFVLESDEQDKELEEPMAARDDLA